MGVDAVGEVCPLGPSGSERMTAATLGQRAQELDPFGLDAYFTGSPLRERTEASVVAQLNDCVRRAAAEGWTPALALAALRDLGFLACAVERRRPGVMSACPGLEALLIDLGRACGHVPRDDNYTYGPANPHGARMRTFTGLDEERLLIAAIQHGLTGADEALRVALALSELPVDAPAFPRCVGLIAPAWHKMIEAAVDMRRNMPPPVFAFEILPWLVPLTVGGTTYRAPTGAAGQNCILDWFLHAADSKDERYQRFWSLNRAEMIPEHRQLVHEISSRMHGSSLLSRIEREVAASGDSEAIDRSVAELEHLLTEIYKFRKVHYRVASESLNLRPYPIGSGLESIELLDLMLQHTQAARTRAKQIQEHGTRTVAAAAVGA